MKCQICGGEIVLSMKVEVPRGCPARRGIVVYSPCGSCGTLHDPEYGSATRSGDGFIVFVDGKPQYLKREEIKVTQQILKESQKCVRRQVQSLQLGGVTLFVLLVLGLIIYLVSK